MHQHSSISRGISPLLLSFSKIPGWYFQSPFEPRLPRQSALTFTPSTGLLILMNSDSPDKKSDSSMKSISPGTDLTETARNLIQLSPEKKSISYPPQNVENRYHSMATMIKNPALAQVPAGSGKKSRAMKKKSPAKGFFGLLPDWKIDTQALKDELRD
jgi:hypothetical protein